MNQFPAERRQVEPFIRKASQQLVAPPQPPEVIEPFGLSADIRATPGDLPTDLAAEQFAKLPPFVNHSSPDWTYLFHQFDWAATNLCHNPIYFEDARVERYGRDFGYLLEPVYSGAKFVISAPLLPLKMLIHPPRSYVCRGDYMRRPKPARPCGYLTRVSLDFARAALYTIGYLIP